MNARASPISTANLRNRPTESGRRTLKKALARRVRHSSAYRLRELAGVSIPRLCRGILTSCLIFGINLTSYVSVLCRISSISVGAIPFA